MGDGADLHTHSTHSDGTASPADLVALAAAADLSAIAITDHDTVAGVAEAADAASGGAVRLIPGVELSAQRAGREVHVVGLFIDPAGPALLEALRRKREERRGRFAEMARRLDELGAPVDAEAALQEGSRENPGRMHLAVALCQAGHVADIQEAFDRYLGEGGPAYVPRTRFTIAEACAPIRGAGGLPVLAHPIDLPKGAIKAMAAEGIAAVEAYSYNFTPGLSRRVRRWARELNLGISGGSDYHGAHRAGAELGAVRLPDEYVADLEERLRPAPR